MHLRILPLLAALALVGACATEDQSLGRAPLGKADVSGSCQTADADFCGGPSDGSCYCDADCLSYGDCCSDYESACGTGYDACEGLTCGESCNPCDPDDPSCVAPAVPFVCQTDGTCGFTIPECEASYEPCGGKLCGDACSVCDPTDPGCFETAEVKVCQPDGSCSGSVPECSVDGDYDPCAGLTCGDTCTLCDPTDVNCVETAVLKACQPDGSCSAHVPSC